MVSFRNSSVLIFTLVFSVVFAQNADYAKCQPPFDINCFIQNAQFTVLGTVLSTNQNTSSTTNYNATVSIGCVYYVSSAALKVRQHTGLIAQTILVTGWGRPNSLCQTTGLGADAKPGDTKIMFLYVTSGTPTGVVPVYSVFDVCQGGFANTTQYLSQISLAEQTKPDNTVNLGSSCALPPAATTTTSASSTAASLPTNNVLPSAAAKMNPGCLANSRDCFSAKPLTHYWTATQRKLPEMFIQSFRNGTVLVKNFSFSLGICYVSPLKSLYPRDLPFCQQCHNFRTLSSVGNQKNSSESREIPGIPYSQLKVGCPRETYPSEARVALTPANVKLLKKSGFQEILIETGAGAAAQFPDQEYVEAGAKIVPSIDEVYGKSDIVLKVRSPISETGEIQKIRKGQTIISFLAPGQNKDLVKTLESTEANIFAMDQIPRITRAQVFDALSSMANIAGYKAVIEASNQFGRFFTGQITAAGKIPPCKVLVIGAGVAGLSAIATARRLGAIVRASDTRSVAREQVESLQAEFIEVSIQEDGAGAGGYAKEMSQKFMDAQLELFTKQCKEVDIIVTTALIPGKRAPTLITKAMVESMRPGSVIVDLAAENGGNCELTVHGKIIEHKNVKIIGYSVSALNDLPSRLPTQSSTLYSNNITKFLLSIGSNKHFNIDLTDEVIRGSIVLQHGKLLWPSPIPISPPKLTAAPKTEKPAEVQVTAISPFKARAREVGFVSGGLGTLVLLGKVTTPVFMSGFTTLGLAGLIGYRIIWGVAPALHSPLMSVTNAISGCVGIGGMFLMGGGLVPYTFAQFLAAASVLLANINIFGGFILSQRMLNMFRRPQDPPDYEYLYAIPALVFSGGFLFSVATGAGGVVQAGYLASSLLCIASLSGLGSQVTARSGNALGVLGVGSGVLSALAAVGFSPWVLGQFSVITAAGAAIGVWAGRRVSPTELPETVALLHSFVGLAAVLTSVASFWIHPGDTLYRVMVYLGTLIGGVTFTGSLVAYAKLSGRLSSKPFSLPNRNLVNISALAANAGGMAWFLSTSSTPVGIGILAINTALSFFKGWHTTSSIGGADMPVVITVLNSYSGWALVAEGLMLQNDLLTTVGSLIGVSGAILSYIMCKAMNRSIWNVLFGSIQVPTTTSKDKENSQEEALPIVQTNVDDVAEALAGAETVIITPGYGLAVAKAQYA
ncbi:hypothetical protein HK096_009277, partial [Nowakowskiella sp. JEL0078]